MHFASRALLVLAQDRGRVAGVGWQLHDRLRRHHVAVDVTTPSRDTVASDHDVVVIGAAVGSGFHRRAIAHYVARNRASLDRVPSALFLVAGAGASAPGHVLQAFERAVAWRPTTAGTVVYRRLDRRARTMVIDVLRSLSGARETDRIDEVEELADAVRQAATYSRTRTRSRSGAHLGVLELPSRAR